MQTPILTVYQKRVILVDVDMDSRERHSRMTEELSQLAATAGAIILAQDNQKRSKPDNAYYIGQGKTQEIAELVQYHNADAVIFNNDLTPAQIRNLESIIQTSVIDRTELILIIFATHARTRQAKLQVELAQLEYTLPRLKHLWGHLSRLGGGAKITRGPGEKQLEVDRRLVFNRLTTLKRHIKEIQKRREQEVSNRSEDFTIALVGYTNTGKSTLMNVLTGTNQSTDDKLFSTLDTKTHIWTLSNGQKVLLSDTVGFIKDLPHHLVSSFYATLEEVRQADLLLHIVDASSQEAGDQIKSVNMVLSELGCLEKETIIVLNKIDAADKLELQILQKGCVKAGQTAREGLPYYNKNAVSISALKKSGLDELEKRIDESIATKQMELSVKVPLGNGRLLAYLHERGVILDKKLLDSSYKIKMRIGKRDLIKAKELGLQ
jgi:GTP-binding protein HflX